MQRHAHPTTIPVQATAARRGARVTTLAPPVLGARRRRVEKDGSAGGILDDIFAKRKDSLCEKDDYSRCGKRLRYSGPTLPEEIWCHIHSLMPLRAAARAACVSHAFLRSWRHRPHLIFTKETMGFKGVNGDIERDFTSRIDEILKRHSGIGVKALKLDIFTCRDLNTCYLNNWLQIAITPGIEKLTLFLPSKYKEGYSFPYPLLFGGSGSSLRYLHIQYCAFRPTAGLGCLRSLTKLHLYEVRITEEELGHLLSSSFSLKQMELRFCSEIICLDIPCLLERLSCLTVYYCKGLQRIESKAPNLSTFNFNGRLGQFSLGQTLQVKNLIMQCFDDFDLLYYASTKLPYMAPNLKTLCLSSIGERVNTPMVAAKFIHLKKLEIYLDADFPEYDYMSLLSFLDASPALNTFILGVDQGDMMSDSVFVDASHMRQMPEHRYDYLKGVMILGFCSAKSMVELACHILENATSLERITVDTVFDVDDVDNNGRCSVNSVRKLVLNVTH